VRICLLAAVHDHPATIGFGTDEAPRHSVMHTAVTLPSDPRPTARCRPAAPDTHTSSTSVALNTKQPADLERFDALVREFRATTKHWRGRSAA